MDTEINFKRWIDIAGAEVYEVECALSAFGAEPIVETPPVRDIANLDAPDLAAYLRDLATKLRTVATNLNYLAEHADLTDLAARPKVGDTSGVAIVTTKSPPPVDNPELEGKTAEELLDTLDALNKGGS